MNVNTVVIDPYALGWTQIPSLSLTSQDLANYIPAEGYRFLKDASYRKSLEQTADSQLQSELDLTREYGTSCPLYMRRSYDVQRNKINPVVLRSMLSTNFYNPAVMESVACNVDAIFYGLPNSKGLVTASQRARKYVTDLHRIGSESVAGYALSAGVSGVNDSIIVKAPRPRLRKCGSDNYLLKMNSNPSDRPGSDLIHELFVGLYATNSMRRKIPNFSYVYGGFRCPPPRIEQVGLQFPVTSWCTSAPNSDLTVPYVLYENISPAMSLEKYITTATPRQFLSALCQIVLSLHIANVDLGYCHYDLHTNNVLMRKVEGIQSFYIPYTIDGVTYYIESDGVATIIDYGNSHVKIDAAAVSARDHGTIAPTQSNIKSYSNPGVWNIVYGQYPDRSFPLYDTFKLLMFSLGRAYDSGNSPVADIIMSILNYYTMPGTDHIRNLTLLNEGLYALPYIPGKTDGNLNYNLFKYITQRYPNVVTTVRPQQGSKILECGSTQQVCLGIEGLARNLGITGNDTRIETFFDYYDLSADLTPQEKSTFDYLTARTNHITALQSQFNALQNVVSGTGKFNLTGMNILTFDVMSKVRSSYSNVYDIVNMVNDLELSITVAIALGTEYKDQILLDWLSKYSLSLQNYRPQLCELLQNATDNYDIICKYQTDNQELWKSAMQEDPRLQWYQTNLADIVALKYNTCKSRFLPVAVTNSEATMPVAPQPRGAMDRPRPYYGQAALNEARLRNPDTPSLRSSSPARSLLNV